MQDSRRSSRLLQHPGCCACANQIYLRPKHLHDRKTPRRHFLLRHLDPQDTLILKFAEMYLREPNKRVFNIKFGERTVIQGLDVVAKVGPSAACDEYIEFEFKKKKHAPRPSKPKAKNWLSLWRRQIRIYLLFQDSFCIRAGWMVNFRWEYLV